MSKTNIDILEQVQDKKITGINGSHFLYLFGDLIERVIIYEKKNEFEILKIQTLIRVQFLIQEN